MCAFFALGGVVFTLFFMRFFYFLYFLLFFLTLFFSFVLGYMWFASCFLRARDVISGGVLWDICNLLCFFF